MDPFSKKLMRELKEMERTGRMMRNLSFIRMMPYMSGSWQPPVDMYEAEGMEVEPSAATGCEGPKMLLNTATGQEFLQKHSLSGKMNNATHIIWTTGGLFVPERQHEYFRRIASGKQES